MKKFEQTVIAAPASLAAGSEWTQDFASKEDFVAKIAHDLTNALAAASAFTEAVVESLPGGDPHRANAERALQGCNLAVRLVNMLREPALWRGRNVHEMEAARADLDQAPVVPNFPQENLRILVVDGRSAAADSLSHGLDTLGHKAFPVYDTQEALNLFYETVGEWDVVISPVRLRGQGGAELLQKVKTADPRVLTVLQTGAPSGVPYSPTGCDLLVENPADACQISETIRRHFGRAGRRSRIRVMA